MRAAFRSRLQPLHQVCNNFEYRANLLLFRIKTTETTPAKHCRMRLLNAETLQFLEFLEPDVPDYAILSHTWEDEEVTFQEMQSGDLAAASKKGYIKIQKCCKQAIRDGLYWIWADSCCIDKTSSEELSEAINSMYQWYYDASRCFAYLSDVDRDADDDLNEAIRKSRWFTRGWTLQELMAPSAVDFFDRNWQDIGSKWSLLELIFSITRIRKDVLLREKPLSECPIRERMSWASDRSTARIEDVAYSLLGIFDIYMPIRYGEGNRAFFRLQERIIKRIEDYSFLLWSPIEEASWTGVLATSPSQFGPECALIYLSTGENIRQSFSVRHSWDLVKSKSPRQAFPMIKAKHPRLTSWGLNIKLLVKKLPDGSLLAWTLGSNYNGALLCIRLSDESPHWRLPGNYAHSPGQDLEGFEAMELELHPGWDNTGGLQLGGDGEGYNPLSKLIVLTSNHVHGGNTTPENSNSGMVKIMECSRGMLNFPTDENIEAEISGLRSEVGDVRVAITTIRGSFHARNISGDFFVVVGLDEDRVWCKVESASLDSLERHSSKWTKALAQWKESDRKESNIVSDRSSITRSFRSSGITVRVRASVKRRGSQAKLFVSVEHSAYSIPTL